MTPRETFFSASVILFLACEDTYLRGTFFPFCCCDVWDTFWIYLVTLEKCFNSHRSSKSIWIPYKQKHFLCVKSHISTSNAKWKSGLLKVVFKQKMQMRWIPKKYLDTHSFPKKVSKYRCKYLNTTAILFCLNFTQKENTSQLYPIHLRYKIFMTTSETR